MIPAIDNPEKNDNRRYEYGEEFYERAEYPIIANWLPAGARILDLGCGNGALLAYLARTKNINGEGIEISASGITAGRKKGFAIRPGQIDQPETYRPYADKQFDFAICNVTLQMVNYPEVLLEEMARVARRLIISFPNFAYWENRLDLLAHGVMPRPMLHGYTWFNTGHIHQLSNRDFKNYCRRHRLRVLRQSHLGAFKPIAWLRPNLLSKETIFLCEKYEL